MEINPFDNTTLHFPPAPFNPAYRPGLGEAVSKAYAEKCESFPYAYQTQAERKALYAEISDRLRPLFPAIGEK